MKVIYVHVIVIFIDVHTYMSINNTENENAFTPTKQKCHQAYMLCIIYICLRFGIFIRQDQRHSDTFNILDE